MWYNIFLYIMSGPGSFGAYVFLFIALYFEVFLLISFLEKRPGKRSSTLPSRYPSVCILVPCFNEEKTIIGTLESLIALEYPKEKLSIMVIDDGSKDNTRNIVEAFITKHSGITYHYKENGGKYTALNFGITKSTADLIGCLDADSFVASDALLEIVKQFEKDSDVYAVTPAMKVFRPKNIIEIMQAVEYTSGIFLKKMFDNLSAITVVPGPFSLYRRDVFDTVGLFRHAYNTEDMEMAFRMHAHDLKISNVHTAYVYTTVPKTLRTLIKQRTRWSQGYLQNSIKQYWYMYFNPRFGNFGLFVLPFGITSLLSGLYTAGYALYRGSFFLWDKISEPFMTGVPVQTPTIHFEWFYLNTSMLSFLLLIALMATITIIVLGQRMAQQKLPITWIASYLAFFGFIAPFWLVQAAWGTIRGKESTWR